MISGTKGVAVVSWGRSEVMGAAAIVSVAFMFVLVFSGVMLGFRGSVKVRKGSEDG